MSGHDARPEEISLADMSHPNGVDIVEPTIELPLGAHVGSHALARSAGREGSEGVATTSGHTGTLRSEDVMHQLPSVTGDAVIHVDNPHPVKTKKKKGNYGTLRFRPNMEVNIDRVAEGLLEDGDNVDGSPQRLTENIRGMTTTLSNKIRIKDKVVERQEGEKAHRVGCLKQCGYSVSMSWRHFKDSVAELSYVFKLWKGHLKVIEGHFGTGVTSYFIFLRSLFILNIPVFLLTFVFVTIPQLVHRGNDYSQNITFQGWELLTGGGWLVETELYYGYHLNGTIEAVNSMEYDMKYAYLCTCAGYYLLTVIILGAILLRSYKKNFIQVSGDLQFPVMKVFCGWDYNINEPKAARLKSKAIFKELEEYLSVYRRDEESRSCSEWCGVLFLRICSNILVLALLGGSGYLIWYISFTQSFKVSSTTVSMSAQQVIEELYLPLCISAINFILPFAFSILASFERYAQPRTELYITMIRTILLNGATLGVLIYFWFTSVNCASLDPNDQDVLDRESQCVDCWEDFMGQQIYRLVIVDFIFILVVTFVFEFIRRLMSQFCCKSLGYPEFNIGRNTLNLIYSQILVWLGTFYSPLLSIIMILKLFFTFYVKRVSVVQNCVPSVKPWRAGQTTTLIQGLTLLAFLTCFVAVAYSIFFLVPSEGCGPYQGYNRSYDVISDLLNQWQGSEGGDVIKGLLEVITSVAFLAFVFIALCIGAHYSKVVADGHISMVNLLRKQIALEGRDKTFLLKLLNEACKRAGNEGISAVSRRPFTATNVDTSSVNLPTPSSGKAFSKAKIAAGTSSTPPSSGRKQKPGTGATTRKPLPPFPNDSHNPGFQQESLERETGIVMDPVPGSHVGRDGSREASNPVYREDSLNMRPNLPYPGNQYDDHRYQ